MEAEYNNVQKGKEDSEPQIFRPGIGDGEAENKAGKDGLWTAARTHGKERKYLRRASVRRFGRQLRYIFHLSNKK